MQGYQEKIKLTDKNKKKGGIIGAGWYGTHLALQLAKDTNLEVKLIDKNPDIFHGVSGNFGVRIHAGPHYPRSYYTRAQCRKDFEQFHDEYEDIIVYNGESIYGLGNKDANGNSSKVTKSTFKKVCEENIIKLQTDDPASLGYKNLLYAAKIYEPSAKVGDAIREPMRKRLENSNVELVLNIEIYKVEKEGEKINVYGRNNFSEKFDFVINATGYQAKSLIPKGINLPFQVKYQACIALIYKDKFPKCDENRFSFIVLDGFFPCIMPYVDEEKGVHKYLLTHGSWTILGSFDEPNKGYDLLNILKKDEKGLKKIREKSEEAINNFYPAFARRFSYLGWKGTVLAKLRTDVEFRSSIVFKSDNNNVIHVFPGKISNVFLEKEIKTLIVDNKEKIVQKEGFSYVKGGAFHTGISEITRLPNDTDNRNTCSLQTYKKFIAEDKSNNKTYNMQSFFSSAKKPNLNIKRKQLMNTFSKNSKSDLKNLKFKPKL